MICEGAQMGRKARFESMRRSLCETRYSTTRLRPGQCGQIHETLKGSTPPSSAITDPEPSLPAQRDWEGSVETHTTITRVHREVMLSRQIY